VVVSQTIFHPSFVQSWQLVSVVTVVDGGLKWRIFGGKRWT
jgi:hypothetical protein